MKQKLMRKTFSKLPYIFVFMLLTTSQLIILIPNSEPVSDDTIVRINPIYQSVSKDDIFQIQIGVDPAEPIEGVVCNLEFDPDVVKVDGITIGEMFSISDGGIIDNDAGTIIGIFGVMIGGNTTNTSGILATVDFTAEKGGTSPLNLFNVTASNSDDNLTPIIVEDGIVAVVDDDIDDTIIRINPTYQSVSKDDTFQIQIEVDPAEPIKGVVCNLEFDSSVVSANSITISEMFNISDGGVINNDAGIITGIFGVMIGDNSTNSSGILATVDFTAEKGGTSPFNLLNATVSNSYDDNLTTIIVEDGIVLVDSISGNNPPYEPTLISPSDDSTVDSETSATLKVQVTDPNGDSMDVRYYDASDDSLIGTDDDVSNGSIASLTWLDLSSDTTYFWYAIANDSELETKSDTWSFTTIYEPDIDLSIEIKGGIGVRTIIKNNGDDDAENVEVTISVNNKGWIEKIDKSVVLSNNIIKSGKKMIASMGLFRVFARIEITVTAECEEWFSASKSVDGFLFGPIVIIKLLQL